MCAKPASEAWENKSEDAPVSAKLPVPLIAISTVRHSQASFSEISHSSMYSQDSDIDSSSNVATLVVSKHDDFDWQPSSSNLGDLKDDDQLEQHAQALPVAPTLTTAVADVISSGTVASQGRVVIQESKSEHEGFSGPHVNVNKKIDDYACFPP